MIFINFEFLIVSLLSIRITSFDHHIYIHHVCLFFICFIPLDVYCLIHSMTNLELHFKHPSTILLSGPTGCGKTRFVRRILKERLIEPFPTRLI